MIAAFGSVQFTEKLAVAAEIASNLSPVYVIKPPQTLVCGCVSKVNFVTIPYALLVKKGNKYKQETNTHKVIEATLFNQSFY